MTREERQELIAVHEDNMRKHARNACLEFCGFLVLIIFVIYHFAEAL